MLTESLIKELQGILAEDYDQKVSLEEATEIASTLINYFYLSEKIYERDKTLEVNKGENI